MRLFSFLLFLSNFATAQPNYEAYNTLLEKYVNPKGNVDYKGLKEAAPLLHRITEDFSTQKPSESWSKNEQMAFWINAYNAFTIQLITDNYPVSSITKLDGGKPWDQKRISINNTLYSLNEIENEVIRPKFKDARVHFAINCAAKSCPPLLNKAFLPSTLDAQLNRQTRRFVRGKSNDLSAELVKISKIFDWYKTDFGDLIVFLNKYATVSIKQEAKIEYMEYNWDLNEQ